MKRSMVALGAALALALSPLAASAQEPAVAAEAGGEDARTLFARGQASYSQGDYDAAIAQWARAYELDPRPLLQFNLSQAYERLGRLEDAIASLERYLERADPQDEHQADARARLAAQRERLGRTSVQIDGGPEGATILIDGEDRGRTPRPDGIRVTPGAHRIVVTLAGRTDFVSTVVVPAGQSIEVPVEMAAPVVATSTEAPIVPIVLLSVGGAALITGAILGGVALADAGSAPSRESPEADAARGLALGADVTMGIGAAVAVAGLVVLLVSGPSSETPAERASLAPWAGPTGGGLVVAGRF